MDTHPCGGKPAKCCKPSPPNVKAPFTTGAASADQHGKRQHKLTASEELVLGEHQLNGLLKVFNHSTVVLFFPKLEKKPKTKIPT